MATRSNATPALAEREAAFSIVIPTHNEASTIRAAVAHALGFPQVEEVVVADGGSNDGTCASARREGARVVRSPRGRARQMNAGAAAARAGNLVFLHADCRLPRGAFDDIAEVFASGCDAGVFGIDYAERHPVLKVMSRLSHWQTPWTQFGEAALFIRREPFARLGGFRDWPLMEDVEILARLRRSGRFGKATGAVQASARRFAEQGVWRQTARNVLCYALYHLGVPPARLTQLYGESEGALRRASSGASYPESSPE